MPDNNTLPPPPAGYSVEQPPPTAAPALPPPPAGYSVEGEQPPMLKTWLDRATDYAKSALGDLGKGAWNNLAQGGEGMVNTAGAVYDTVRHPIDTLQGKAGITALAGNLGAAQGAVAQKAEESFKKGDYANGVRHVIDYLIPLLGPQVDAMGDKAGSGHPMEALGESGMAALQLAGPSIAGGARVPILPKVANANPLEAAAMDYVAGEGVPVSAAARTGNAYVRGVQKMADTTPLGTIVASKAERATAEGLRDLSGRLADRANSFPVVPEQAGQGIQTSLGVKMNTHAQNAATSYNAFRQIEGQPSSVRSVQVGTRTVSGIDPVTQQRVIRNVPVMEDIAMPTDLTALKKDLVPVYEDMQKWMEPAKRNASAGFQALKSIVEGPDVIPASQAEAGLGGLKQLAREASGRNSGIAKMLVPKLQDLIDDSVSAIDRHALTELQAGRAETAAQFGTKAVLDQLRTEPVQTFGQMTYAKDAGIHLVRQINKEAPGELPKVGRAWLEDVFTRAQGEGAFDHAHAIWQKWQNLGPETKKLLFPNSGLVDDLDKFFLAAKKIAENPNPSGTAVVWMAGQSTLAVIHPTTGIPYLLGAGAMSKMLHSPAGVQALTKGLSMPVKGPIAAFTAGQLLKMAGKDVTPITQLPAQFPKAASTDDPSQQIGPLATVVRP